MSEQAARETEKSGVAARHWGKQELGAGDFLSGDENVPKLTVVKAT